MAMTDPIADMLTRLRNGQQAGHNQVEIPASRLKKSVLDVLVREGYLRGVEETQSEQGHALLVAQLKYHQGEPVIRELSRTSRPGLRRYTASGDIPMVKNGLGVTIMSTSKGVISDTQARELNVGGEILAQVF
jgi:small subunit ribosomal protein S8